ncbi:hypothetical protein PPAR_a0747 [Pseudoalteromonas paragorgicola KMM 3548]|nr:hypothetical protein [Pseudoalteromonas distincta KMM 3548]
MGTLSKQRHSQQRGPVRHGQDKIVLIIILGYWSDGWL